MFAQLESLDLTAVAILSVIGIVGVVIVVPAIIVTNWRGHRQRILGAELVRDMMAQGMSATDIEKILMVWSADAEAVAKIYRRRSKEEDKLAGIPPMKGMKPSVAMKPPIAS